MKKPTHQLPISFLDRLQDLLPTGTYQKTLAFLNQNLPTTLRVNTLKSDKVGIISLFARHNISYTEVPWLSGAFIINNCPLRTLSDLPEYEQGFFYIQSLSSMVPPLILGPKPDEKILDLTAAPGSKTTQIAALMQNSGEIVAADNNQVRIYRLQANLQRQGVKNTRCLRAVGQSFWQKYPEYFDKVLADVPCSMEGRIRLTAPESFLDWSTKKIKELVKIQKFLLRSAVSCAKVGGVIVYSTCTMSPEENENIIDWILKKENGAVSTESVSLNGLNSSSGITEWRGKKYSEKVKSALRIWPDDTMEGFFVAKLKKNRSTVPITVNF